MKKVKTNLSFHGEHGITLVALIITIIVLIILAAVTIVAVVKSNITEIATQGTENYSKAQVVESKTMDDLADFLESTAIAIEDISSGNNEKAFIRNPDQFAHPNQSASNKNRAIGSNGEAVNLDLWRYTKINEAGLILGKHVDSYDINAVGYIGAIKNGQIDGEVPYLIYLVDEGKVYPVTALCSTFAHNTELVTAPKLPNTITLIDSLTFENCSNLKSITIPDSVKSIGSFSFNGCTSLTNITIPGSITSIGDYAFYLCNKLANIKMQNNITSIGSYAFADCSSLTEVNIPNTVTSIGYGAFQGCTKVNNIVIPSSVSSIGSNVFYGWTNSQTIDCSAFESKPSGWNTYWNNNCNAQVIWKNS